jgi:hypothetical protein
MWSIVWGGNIAKRRGILDGKGDCGADQRGLTRRLGGERASKE